MMGRFARTVRIALVGVVCACNAITGADGLGTDETNGVEAPLPARHGGGDTSSSSGTATSSSSSGGASTSSSSSGEIIDPDGGSLPDAGTDTGVPNTNGTVFTDPFTRADNAAVGNGWIEKTDVFSIAGGAVKQTDVGSYRNLFVRRPAAEDALDVEISVDVTHSALQGDPCLYARMQPASSTAGALFSYTFYAYSDYAFLDRDTGSTNKDIVGLAAQTISPAFTAPYTYSMSLKVTGTDPVHLVAQVKDANGNVKINFVVDDASAGRITSPGGVAFGSGGANGALFDNFKRTTF